MGKQSSSFYFEVLGYEPEKYEGKLSRKQEEVGKNSGESQEISFQGKSGHPMNNEHKRIEKK